MSNCPLKHLHIVIPPEVKGHYYQTKEWLDDLEETHYQVKCSGCNKYLIWVKRDKN